MKLENLKKPHIIILAVCAVLALISVIFTGVRLYKINFLDSELEKLYAKEEEYENQALWDEYDALSEAADDAEFAVFKPDEVCKITADDHLILWIIAEHMDTDLV